MVETRKGTSTPRYHIPIDPNMECYPLVGEIAVRWGWVEHQAIVILREMLKLTKPQGLMAFGKVGIQGKVGAMLALSQHIFGDAPLAVELRKLAKSIQAFDDIRNDVIHGLWVHDGGDATAVALLRRENVKQKVMPQPDRDAFKSLPANVAKLRGIQDEAQRLTIEIKALKKNFKPVG